MEELRYLQMQMSALLAVQEYFLRADSARANTLFAISLSDKPLTMKQSYAIGYLD